MGEGYELKWTSQNSMDLHTLFCLICYLTKYTTRRDLTFAFVIFLANVCTFKEFQWCGGFGLFLRREERSSFLPFPFKLTCEQRPQWKPFLPGHPLYITSLIPLWKHLDKPGCKTVKAHSVLQQVLRCAPFDLPLPLKHRVAQFPRLRRCWWQIS